jgi:hypothetical protein
MLTINLHLVPRSFTFGPSCLHGVTFKYRYNFTFFLIMSTIHYSKCWVNCYFSTLSFRNKDTNYENNYYLLYDHDKQLIIIYFYRKYIQKTGKLAQFSEVIHWLNEGEVGVYCFTKYLPILCMCCSFSITNHVYNF